MQPPRKCAVRTWCRRLTTLGRDLRGRDWSPVPAPTALALPVTVLTLLDRSPCLLDARAIRACVRRSREPVHPAVGHRRLADRATAAPYLPHRRAVVRLRGRPARCRGRGTRLGRPHRAAAVRRARPPPAERGAVPVAGRRRARRRRRGLDRDGRHLRSPQERRRPPRRPLALRRGRRAAAGRRARRRGGPGRSPFDRFDADLGGLDRQPDLGARGEVELGHGGGRDVGQHRSPRLDLTRTVSACCSSPSTRPGQQSRAEPSGRCRCSPTAEGRKVTKT